MAIDQAEFAGSNLESGEYDPETQTMRIVFQNGRVYLWPRVDPVMWDRLKTAASAGRFLMFNFPEGIEE